MRYSWARVDNTGKMVSSRSIRTFAFWTVKSFAWPVMYLLTVHYGRRDTRVCQEIVRIATLTLLAYSWFRFAEWTEGYRTVSDAVPSSGVSNFIWIYTSETSLIIITDLTTKACAGYLITRVHESQWITQSTSRTMRAIKAWRTIWAALFCAFGHAWW